ncbi:MAG: class I SAM-dependent methyltransferase [Candidatus Limnocylindria bacterium]
MIAERVGIPTPRDSSIPYVLREALLGGRLPVRYDSARNADFLARIRRSFTRDLRILDVGSGRQPVLLPGERPENCTYAGLDISATELDAAPSGAYDVRIVSDIATRAPDLDEKFDLIVSFQVLEHVFPLRTAIENIRTYLRPGGKFVAQLSGGFALFALANRVVPRRFTPMLLKLTMGRNPKSVFPARYDGCWYGALEKDFFAWSQVEITPQFTGAPYFAFFRPALVAYLAYEEWALRRRSRNLATHYLIEATR